MEALFRTTVKMNFEEYKKWNFRLQRKKKKYIILYAVLMVIMGFLMAYFEQYIFGGIVLLYGCFYPLLIKLRANRKLLKNYDSNKVMKDAEYTISFYEDYYHVQFEAGENKVMYHDIYDIIETDTNFYLMIGKNQGLIIIKEGCTKELCTFIRTIKQKINRLSFLKDGERCIH